ncbi:IclR family transcriptional regulator [Oligosphaera ethanolica]|uniref:DNA-binding IclR family transcriptional regulator n=1 Tax=Oligosphaera ethanolica TaxID=760260 RepID=A0AAE3VFE0_9BACT|nr:IclR family transcriptional regulator [Oligosphaera ethanolica]MDQ0289514.1 DNA-binding IclR family transcriptional regulator [Oligosphaera ethanolica]
MSAGKPNEATAGKRYAAPAVDAMLDILEYLSQANRPCGVTELSRELGITNNLAFRVMKRLVERGYAETGSTASYKLGTRFFTLGMKLYSDFELRKRARPHLEWLSGELGETAQVHAPDGDRMLVVDTVTPHASYFLQVVPGSRVYYHNNAFGKAVMAFMDEKDVRRLLPKERLPSLTHNTITSADALISQLAQVRKTGVAFDNEEYMYGIFCIGSPVFNHEGKAVAGLGCTGLTSRYQTGGGGGAIKAVLAAAENVSRDLGYDGEFFAETKNRNDPERS